MTLEMLFQPLDNWRSGLTELQLSKTSVKTPYRRNPKLRIYAVRIDRHTYVVTGGAIKVTPLMKERPHTLRQYEKLVAVRDWLKDEGIVYAEDLTTIL